MWWVGYPPILQTSLACGHPLPWGEGMTASGILELTRIGITKDVHVAAVTATVLPNRCGRKPHRQSHILAAFPTVYLSKNRSATPFEATSPPSRVAATVFTAAFKANSIGIGDDTEALQAVNSIGDLFWAAGKLPPWASMAQRRLARGERLVRWARNEGCLPRHRRRRRESRSARLCPYNQGPSVLSHS